MTRTPRHIIRCLAATALLAAATRANPLPEPQKRPDGNIQIGTLLIRTAPREITFPARFQLAEGALEVIIAKPNGRLHEALLVTPVSAVALQTALYLLKARNGMRTDVPDAGRPRGTLVDIDIEWKDDHGTAHRTPVEAWILDTRTKQPMKRIGWTFTGSGIHRGQFLADSEGNLVLNWSHGATVLDIPDPDGLDDTIHIVHTAQIQPKKYPDVTVIITPRQEPEHP